MKVGLVGSVGSSLITLQKLMEHQFDVVGVWGYEPESILNVSGYCSLRQMAEEHNLPFYPFIQINSEETKRQILSANMDILFVVGLSQLVSIEIIEAPKYGCVGFHPTRLPKGRGRAPLAWLVMNEKEGAATFFKIDETADAGMIYVQEPFVITPADDAFCVANKVKMSMSIALDRWLPVLSQGIIEGTPQDEAIATYYARRAPLDGCINWFDEAYHIDRLIKASSHPHPGAFSFYGDNKVFIWKACYYSFGFARGVIGRVVEIKNENPVVQAKNGFVELLDYQIVNIDNNKVEKSLIVGSRLGYYDQYEIFKLRNEIKWVKEQINKLMDGK